MHVSLCLGYFLKGIETGARSFQQALMAGGIAKQLELCPSLKTTTVDINPIPPIPPTWCADTNIVSGLQAAQSRLWVSIRGASSSKSFILLEVQFAF